MLTSGRYSEKKYLNVFVMLGGFAGRRIKFKHCFFPSRGGEKKKSLTKTKKERKCLTPIQSNTNGSSRKKNEEEKKLLGKIM